MKKLFILFTLIFIPFISMAQEYHAPVKILYFLDLNKTVYLKTNNLKSIKIQNNDTQSIWVDNSFQQGIYISNDHTIEFNGVIIQSVYNKLFINHIELTEQSAIVEENGKISIGRSIPEENPNLLRFIF